MWTQERLHLWTFGKIMSSGLCPDAASAYDIGTGTQRDLNLADPQRHGRIDLLLGADVYGELLEEGVR